MNGNEALRIYLVCDGHAAGYNPVKNWLRMPYLQTNMPTRLYVEIRYF